VEEGLQAGQAGSSAQIDSSSFSVGGLLRAFRDFFPEGTARKNFENFGDSTPFIESYLEMTFPRFWRFVSARANIFGSKIFRTANLRNRLMQINKLCPFLHIPAIFRRFGYLWPIP